MPNEYKSFFLSDLMSTIRETALETMLPAGIYDEEIDTLRTALISTYNDGIRTFSDILIDRLTEKSKE